jgi:hypothetical protein
MKILKLIFIFLITFLFSCKKKVNEPEYTTTVTFYKNCYEVAANTTYYILDGKAYGFTTNSPVPVTTNEYGVAVFKTKKILGETYSIAKDSRGWDGIGGFKSVPGEDSHAGSLYESATCHLVLKLKTNHLITNLDTIKYVFQYGNFRAPIYGPITKDTIIGMYTMDINIDKFNFNQNAGEQKIIWWNFGMPTSTNQTQVNYTIHGCAAVADTAYIIVP